MSGSDYGGSDCEFSDHARYEFGRRGIDLEMARQVLADPPRRVVVTGYLTSKIGKYWRDTP